jgi:hypothetical protein
MSFTVRAPVDSFSRLIINISPLIMKILITKCFLQCGIHSHNTKLSLNFWAEIWGERGEKHKWKICPSRCFAPQKNTCNFPTIHTDN